LQFVTSSVPIDSIVYILSKALNSEQQQTPRNTLRNPTNQLAMPRMKQSWLPVLFLSLSLSFSTSAISISAPRSPQDWQQLAALEVQVFDCPTAFGPQLAWTLFEKERTTRYAYQRHVTTARQFRGTKYAVFCAKHDNKVIGMVELGVVAAASGAAVAITEEMDVRRPTVGVMCVDHNHRGQGVGTMLLDHCNHVVLKVWKESRLYCEVEESNEAASRFFERRGFVPTGRIVAVKVQRNRSVEQRPHSLLCKELFVPADSSIEPQ
jgi:ribosomal protein S18 acetylase RimI-like enzyme